MTIHIHAPPIERFCAVHLCPTCERLRRMLGEFAEWYGVTFTCAGCGDKWTDCEMHERPFAPKWREQNIRRARAALASIGVQA